MTAPSVQVRGQTYTRDNYRCVDCGTHEGLTWQHRAASGHGGRGKKAPLLTTADGLTMCAICNAKCEAEGQSRALALGYKIRRNRTIEAAMIPWFDRNDRAWFIALSGAMRAEIDSVNAAELLAAAGNFTTRTGDRA